MSQTVHRFDSDPAPSAFQKPGIPPEASTGQTPPVFPDGDQSAWQRFAEDVDSGLCWDPNGVAQDRIIAEESLPLEQRGLTSHPKRVSKSRTGKLSQAEFWKLQTTHKFVVAAKLHEQGMHEDAQKLENCHSYYTVATCCDCGKVRKFPNRCDLFFCPECANHLQNERTRQVEWWAERIPQPKHVVLTTKRIRDITPEHVDELRKMFGQLRRRKFARNWKGGYYGIQITYTQRGWMLHIHALVNARWIDENELKQQWRSVTRGFGYIVHVSDCRREDYLRETTRYVIHGSKLAAWQPGTIETFVRAFQGKRTFGVFGSLFGARTEFAEWIATLKQAKPRCDCGSCMVRYQSEADWLVFQDFKLSPRFPRPPPPTHQQTQLITIPVKWPD